MTGRNPWVVLGVAEDAPYQEVQRAYRRRVKQTHPDRGGDAGEFASVVEAFEVVRDARPLQHRRGPSCPTPYDRWLRPYCPPRSWTDDDRQVPLASRPAGWAKPPGRPPGSDFTSVLLGEMSKVRAAPAQE